MTTQEPVEPKAGSDAAVEVSGRAVLQVVEGMPDPAEEKARDILAEKGIEDPDPDAWYPRESWLGAFQAVQERLGEATLREIGRTVVSNVDWPEEAETFADGVEAVDRAYHSNHRGGDPGGYEVAPSGDRTVHVRCRTPHPEPFDEAIVKETARAFSDGVISEVSPLDDPDGKDGHVLEVSWWGIGGR